MTKTILIAAGGTGGHIYPALAIASALKRENPELEIEFVGTPHGLENQLIPRAGFPLHHLPVGRLNRNVSWRERFWTALTLPVALAKAVALVILKKPRFILGVGGAVSGPLVLAGSLLGRKTFFWEPNAEPGLANRWLAPFAGEALVVFDEAAKRLKARHTHRVGMPVRAEIEALAAAEPQPGPILKVFVFGGSQGAKALNDVTARAILSGGEWLDGVEFLHQTGPADFARVKNLYEQTNAKVDVREYVYDMDQAYRWANLVISRAGISSVSELAACGKAAVLVPLPTAADNHQLRNAEALAAKSAAVLVLQKDFTTERLKSIVSDFKIQPEKLRRLGQNIRQFYQAKADLTIARHLLEASR